MRTFLVPVLGLALVGLLTYWLHRRLVVATGLRGAWARAVDVILGVGALLGVTAFAVGGALDPAWARVIGFVGFTWWAALFYLILGVLLIGLVSLLLRGVAKVRDVAPAVSLDRRRRWVAGSSAALVVVVAVIVGYGLFEASRPRIKNETVAVTGLPVQFEGTRIALITDLHVGPARGESFVRGVVEKVAAEKPDLILFGGDLADGTITHVGEDLAPLKDLRAPLGIYGVSGNHEYYADDGGSWLDYWETLGIRALRNETVPITRDGATIDLAGIYDKTAPEPWEPDADKALAGHDDARVLIYAAHQPSQAEDVEGRGVDLQVSGHTHDGQLWPFTYAVRLANPVHAGFGTVGDVPVYVSRGTGAWGPPVRVMAPPEITILTLTEAADEE
ncbi:MAG: metallophosphoesterase [Gordonia sp. (in: high G+C Gram-positive bacteria)]|uniref:metallophosphoesterase n=1 Tax=Gordonia sp. (in: high G+C Gram-positive bacteria) TaxID=84139 RepID=UPI0039E5BBF5